MTASIFRASKRPHTFFYADPPYWQTKGYGAPFEFEQYERLAAAMYSCKAKMMVSINDRPDIRRVFGGLHFADLKIRYSVANNHGASPAESGELVITNFDISSAGSLF